MELGESTEQAAVCEAMEEAQADVTITEALCCAQSPSYRTGPSRVSGTNEGTNFHGRT
jgi:hypothetical protein